MGNLRNTWSILSTIQASAADLSVANHQLSITGCPTVDTRTMQNWGDGLNSSLTEVAQITTVTVTAANSTIYNLYVSQWVPSLGKMVYGYLTYESAVSGDTATTICNALRTSLSAQTQLKITGSGTSTLILTGQTGEPLFTITNISPVTTTQSSAQAGVAIASSTTVTTGYVGPVFTANAHGQVSGDVVTLSAVANTTAGTYRVVKIDANTYYLRSVDGQSPLYASGSATATVAKVAQYSRGTYTDLIAAGVSTATAGSTYAQLPNTYNAQVGSLLGNVSVEQDKHTLYILESATNYEDLRVRIVEAGKAYASGATVSDPEFLAMAN